MLEISGKGLIQLQVPELDTLNLVFKPNKKQHLTKWQIGKIKINKNLRILKIQVISKLLEPPDLDKEEAGPVIVFSLDPEKINKCRMRKPTDVADLWIFPSFYL